MDVERLFGREKQEDCVGKIVFADSGVQITKEDSRSKNQGIGALSRIRGNSRSVRKRPFTTRGLPVHRRRRKQHI